VRRDSPENTDQILADVVGFLASARRVVARGHDRFFDPDDDEQRRIAGTIVLDLATAADRLPASVREEHPEIAGSDIRALRDSVALGSWQVDNGELWEALTIRLPQIAASLGLE
jgi:uncharacterized protein with HEPN domain